VENNDASIPRIPRAIRLVTTVLSIFVLYRVLLLFKIQQKTTEEICTAINQ
jgi:hypothetical protein